MLVSRYQFWYTLAWFTHTVLSWTIFTRLTIRWWRRSERGGVIGNLLINLSHFTRNFLLSIWALGFDVDQPLIFHSNFTSLFDIGTSTIRGWFLFSRWASRLCTASATRITRTNYCIGRIVVHNQPWLASLILCCCWFGAAYWTREGGFFHISHCGYGAFTRTMLARLRFILVIEGFRSGDLQLITLKCNYFNSNHLFNHLVCNFDLVSYDQQLL